MSLPHYVKRPLIDLLVWVVVALIGGCASGNWWFGLVAGFIMACEADAGQRGR